MASTATLLKNLVPISDFSHGKAAQAFAKASSAPVVVLKNNRPEAVIISPDAYDELMQEIEDYEDYCMATERLERLERGERTTVSEAEVLAEFGITEEELDAMPDVELE